MSSRLSRLILILLILLAFSLRVYELDAQSFWYDEGVTAQVAQLGVSELARWTADDIQPPLYYLIAGAWLRFNPFGELILRFPSVFFGTLLIPLLWALGRRFWHDWAGLIAALVATTSPLMVYYSQEARMYAQLVTLTTLAALIVVRLLDRGMARRWMLLVAYAITGIAAMYTHYFAGFALLVLVLYWAHIWRRTGRESIRLAEFALANLAVLLGYLPWFPAMANRFAVDSSYWSGTLKLGEALRDVGINFTTGATEVMLESNAVAWLPWFLLAAAIWLLALVLAGHRGRQRPLTLILLWLILPTILILALAYRTPKFNPRYLMVSWPAWALLAGGGIGLLWDSSNPDLRKPGWAGKRLDGGGAHLFARLLALLTLTLLLIAQLSGLANWYTDDNFAKSGWRDAISYMYSHRQEDETVLLVSGHAYPVFDTYVPARFGVERQRLPELDILDVNRVIGWEEGAQALNRYLDGKNGVWLFLWQDNVVDPAHVVSTLLDRYADRQTVPDYPYLGLRHYRLNAERPFPEQPPRAGTEVDFGGMLELVGIEPSQDGLWLYWQAESDDLPDLQIKLTVTGAGSEILYEADMRPAGYEFPTTRWQASETYPVWLPTGTLPENARINLTVYEAGDGTVIGDGAVEVRP